MKKSQAFRAFSLAKHLFAGIIARKSILRGRPETGLRHEVDKTFFWNQPLEVH